MLICVAAAFFASGTGYAATMATIFHPISGEYDLIGKNPGATDTIRNVDPFNGTLDELKSSIVPELELVERRIIAPTKELQVIMKQIRKSIK